MTTWPSLIAILHNVKCHYIFSCLLTVLLAAKVKIKKYQAISITSIETQRMIETGGVSFNLLQGGTVSVAYSRMKFFYSPCNEYHKVYISISSICTDIWWLVKCYHRAWAHNWHCQIHKMSIALSDNNNSLLYFSVSCYACCITEQYDLFDWTICCFSNYKIHWALFLIITLYVSLSKSQIQEQA